MISAIKFANQSDLTTHKFNFKQKLQDIAKIAIASDMTITYEDFESLEVAPHLKEYLNQISLADRNQYLAAKLQKYLYSIFTTLVVIEDDTSDREEMANYVKKWSRTKFYQQLTQNNHGRGYSDSNWLVIKQGDDFWHVAKNGLTLHIKPEMHLVEPLEELSPGQLVSLKMPSNLVDLGIYIAVGDAGSTKISDGDRNFTITQLYFNVSSEGALCLLDNLTQKLNEIKVPFDFKIAYDEAKFHNLDAVVLEFQSGNFDLIYPIVKIVYHANQNYFEPEIPFFCQFLAPGMGLAEKPRSPNFARENIGQHYCRIIANALVKRWQQNDLLGTDKLDLDYVLNYLSEAGVDIEHPYLNPHSTESYQA
jgi:hypothetical protein